MFSQHKTQLANWRWKKQTKKTLILSFPVLANPKSQTDFCSEEIYRIRTQKKNIFEKSQIHAPNMSTSGMQNENWTPLSNTHDKRNSKIKERTKRKRREKKIDDCEVCGGARYFVIFSLCHTQSTESETHTIRHFVRQQRQLKPIVRASFILFDSFVCRRYDLPHGANDAHVWARQQTVNESLLSVTTSKQRQQRQQ